MNALPLPVAIRFFLCRPLPFLVLAASASVLAAEAPSTVAVSSVVQRPWILDDKGTLKSETELTIDNPRPQPVETWVRVNVPGRPPCAESLGSLAPGSSRHIVHVPELTKDNDTVTFTLLERDDKGPVLATKALPQRQIRHWRLYLIHNSHQDIGYTDYQEDLKNKKWPGFWDQAILTDMPKSDSLPPDARVRLEAEGVFQLQTSLPVRDADWFETLRARMKEGRFAYSAAFGDIAHNNWGAEELARSAYYAERLMKDRTGVESSHTIVMRDEPTLSWGVIDALVDSGAKSFILQHNYDHNLWRGTTSYPEFFYAQGKDPKKKLLVWNSLFGGYGEDELRLRNANTADTMNRIAAKLMGYQSAGQDDPAAPYAAAKAVDGVTGKQDQGEWASNGEKKPWIQLNWTKARRIERVRLFDRNNPSDNATGGTLRFSDGSTVEVAGLPADGAPKEVGFPPRSVTWVRFQATLGSGPNVGLSEIEVYSGARNIAPEARPQASTTFGAPGGPFDYPYDVAVVVFTAGGDNNPMVPQVYASIKALNEKGYAFPRLICSNYKEFFDDLARHGAGKIPSYKGTVEDWWNFGAASTAYETALNRTNHDKLAVAETMAAWASAAVPARRYPSEALSTAWENLQLYDEHTWGSPTPAVDQQWRWKRNTALAADLAANQVLKESTAALDALIPAPGPTVVVRNNLSWTRSDLVTLPAAGLPVLFDLTDSETKKPLPWQRLDEATVAFVASGVPGLGYKTFLITPRPGQAPPPGPTLQQTNLALENKFFTVSFDAAGNVTSILDKQHGNVELVDNTAPHRLNQYLCYKEGAPVGSTTTAAVTATRGPVLACVTAVGGTVGLDGLRRTVVIYDSLPRIDFINEANKGKQIANVEMGYFAFPLKAGNFVLRHEMPTGDMRPGVNADVDDPHNEQYYSSSTAFYTVNRWIDVSNQRDHGITFTSPTAPLVCYGRPDVGATKGGWNVNYNAEKPWIYSMAFNNEWQTNFQKTQPGRVTFCYSLRGHAGGTWQAGQAETFGAETFSPLRASVIAAAQPGAGLDAARGQFLRLKPANVVLTVAKMAEANGEGLVLRFNEIAGRSATATVDLSWLAPASVTETDIVENDLKPVKLEGQTLAFRIDPFAFRTFRLTRGPTPAAVAEMAASFDESGCLVSWKDQPGAACFEVFRSPEANFQAGTGTYVATVSTNHWFDPSVKAGLKRDYHYAVRAVGAGKKGPFSPPAKAGAGLAPDTEAPTPPVLTGESLHATKVTLSWLPSTDNRALQSYKVYRDGAPIAEIEPSYNSWMDDAVKPDTTYQYAVRACDRAGNLSPETLRVPVKTMKE